MFMYGWGMSNHQTTIVAYITQETRDMWTRFRAVTRKLGVPRSRALAQAAQLWLDKHDTEG